MTQADIRYVGRPVGRDVPDVAASGVPASGGLVRALAPAARDRTRAGVAGRRTLSPFVRAGAHACAGTRRKEVA